MNCLVTAGPTFEPLDQVRRLTNFSTGRLGVELANFLTDRGHAVTLFCSESATYPGARRARQVVTFSTTRDLERQLAAVSGENPGGVFHAAAVSDFAFGRIWARTPAGELTELRSGKISTRQGALLAELVPTPKLLPHLRAWFPTAKLVGWKFEVEGDRARVLRVAEAQCRESRTDACVVNGPGFGAGFGLISQAGDWVELATREALFAALAQGLDS
ncbi:MAG TPA: phosphopantothenoylcysteine decarboxylase [Verrucomicrobiota bacterium]|nr:phosphopantothenoylcysteine decarboxylase [Verrucomicrobiota bacterium]HNT15305.1 phosphopantothenoylcysteine decarboxylase [Verrucomicrobiota bacterium]